MAESVRIDKWLWEVRLYKTRSLAAEACRSGRVSISGINVKPSRELKTEDVIEIHSPELTRKVKVTGFPSNRVSPKLVADFMEDLTPVEEIEKLKLKKKMNFEMRPRGIGRPTKKERRSIEKLKRSKF